jgi:hypothetical protein
VLPLCRLMPNPALAYGAASATLFLVGRRCGRAKSRFRMIVMAMWQRLAWASGSLFYSRARGSGRRGGTGPPASRPAAAAAVADVPRGMLLRMRPQSPRRRVSFGGGHRFAGWVGEPVRLAYRSVRHQPAHSCEFGQWSAFVYPEETGQFAPHPRSPLEVPGVFAYEQLPPSRWECRRTATSGHAVVSAALAGDHSVPVPDRDPGGVMP